MKIRVIKCSNCGSVITSRANHDYNSCQCGILAVDGGAYIKEVDTQGFGRIIGKFQREDISVLELPITPEELYQDWNKQINELKDLRKYA